MLAGVFAVRNGGEREEAVVGNGEPGGGGLISESERESGKSGDERRALVAAEGYGRDWAKPEWPSG